jgi:uncharacterized phage protein (TIGR02220 family)/predicted phage replisome organizer
MGSDVKWIKVYTDLSSNKKIKRIRKMPEGNNIILIWVFLLTTAGDCNRNGALYLTDTMPFREEDLAIEFDFEIETIRFALITLENFRMIEIFEDVIYIKNWEEYQNVDGLEKIREQTRKRMKEYRERKKLSAFQLDKEDGEKFKMLRNGYADVTHGYGTELELELELDKDKERDIKDIVPFKEIIDYLNQVCSTNFRVCKSNKRFINARWEEKYTLDDFKKVIDKKAKQWLGDQKMQEYLRPSTLFGTKFNEYLGQKEGPNGGGNGPKPGPSGGNKKSNGSTKTSVVDWENEDRLN